MIELKKLSIRRMMKTTELRIPADAVCKGNITVSGDARIDGTVRGDVYAENGNILLSAGSNIVGNVSGLDVAAGGSMQGDVLARGQMSIFAGAHIIGNITAQALVAEQDAVFEGYVKIAVAPKQAAAQQGASRNAEFEREQSAQAGPINPEQESKRNAVSLRDMFFRGGKGEDMRNTNKLRN